MFHAAGDGVVGCLFSDTVRRVSPSGELLPTESVERLMRQGGCFPVGSGARWHFLTYFRPFNAADAPGGPVVRMALKGGVPDPAFGRTILPLLAYFRSEDMVDDRGRGPRHALRSQGQRPRGLARIPAQMLTAKGTG